MSCIISYFKALPKSSNYYLTPSEPERLVVPCKSCYDQLPKKLSCDDAHKQKYLPAIELSVITTKKSPIQIDLLYYLAK